MQPGKSSQRSSVSSVSSQAKLSQSSSNSHSLLKTHAQSEARHREETPRSPGHSQVVQHSLHLLVNLIA